MTRSKVTRNRLVQKCTKYNLGINESTNFDWSFNTGDYFFSIHHIMYSGADMLFELQAGSDYKLFQDGGSGAGSPKGHTDNLCGTAGEPFILNPAGVIPPNTEVYIKATDVSGTAGLRYLTFEGIKLYANELDPLPAATFGAILNGQVDVDAAAANKVLTFKTGHLRKTLFVTGISGVSERSDELVGIRVGESSNMSVEKCHVANIYGTGKRMHWFPEPIEVPPNFSLYLTYQNLSAVASSLQYVSLVGYYEGLIC